MPSVLSRPVHAAGVVISDQPLTDLVPLYVDKERDEAALSITQYSMKGVEEIGLIKFDFLALKNLTLITDTLTLIKAGGKEAPDLNRLRLDDADTYKMLSRGDTVGVFQLESSGMRRFITELKPTCFDDVIAAGSLLVDSVKEKSPLERLVVRPKNAARLQNSVCFHSANGWSWHSAHASCTPRKSFAVDAVSRFGFGSNISLLTARK